MIEVAMALCDKYKEFYPGKELPVTVHGDGSKDDNFLEDIYLKHIRQTRISPNEIGKATIGTTIEKKDMAMAKVNQDEQMVIDKENKKEGEEL